MSSARKPFRWKRRLIVYGAAYLLFLVLNFSCHLTDRLVLIPTTHPIRHQAKASLLPYAHGQVQILKADSPAVDAEPAGFVLEFTGNATRAEEIAEWTAYIWRKQPVQVWAVNYPGYGQSIGPARLRSAADAALTAYDALRHEAGDRPIFIVGTSLGTAAALHVAANRPDAAGLILTHPPALRQLIRGHHGWWNLWLIALPVSFGIPDELDSLANAARCRMPAAFVTSTRDEVVPVKYQRLVANAYAGPKSVHNRDTGGHNEPMEATESAWIETQVGRLWGLAHSTIPAATTAPALDSEAGMR